MIQLFALISWQLLIEMRTQCPKSPAKTCLKDDGWYFTDHDASREMEMENIVNVND